MDKIVQELMSHIAPSESMEMQQEQVQANAQASSEYQRSLALKNQGNQLHGIGKYSEAIKTYLRAKENLITLKTPEALSLGQACSLNLMACYLKLKEFEKTIAEGMEVLESDSNNLKALYRRGQAYKALGKLRLAFYDLSKAVKIAPNDETVVDELRQLQDQLGIDGEVVHSPAKQNEPISKATVEADAPELSFLTSSSEGIVWNPSQPSEREQQATKIPNTTEVSQPSGIQQQYPAMCLRGLQPVAMKNLETEQVAPVNVGQLAPELVKMASDMVNQISLEDNNMKKTFDMISHFEKQSMVNTVTSMSTSSTSFTRDLSPSGSSNEGSILDFMARSGDILNTSSETQEQLKLSSTSLTQDLSFSGTSNEDSTLDFTARNGDNPNTSPEMQEQLRMKDPLMKETMRSMVQIMKPECILAVSEQGGVKLSQKDTEEAKSAMGNLTTEDLERLMVWVNRAHEVAEGMRKGKEYLLGKPCLILAIIMLIIAVVLHW